MSGIEAMRSRVTTALKAFIPLFAGKPSHPFVPLDDRTAGARGEGQGRPLAGASRAPLTVASTLAGWRRGGDRGLFRRAVLAAVGALSLGSGAGTADAQSGPSTGASAANPYAAHITEASQRFGIPEHWILAVLRAESGGNVRAISSAGAMGLMQVMPDTWAGLRIRHRLGSDPYEPRDNILAGTAYLREMWERYGNIGAMLAAYNAGPARYDEYRATGRPLPVETRAYVAALAPVLGGVAAPGGLLSASSPPLDWRKAPLFAARSGGTRTAASSPPGTHSTEIRVINMEPQHGDIFVARASDGGAP
jgi:hypothetical protein